MLVVLVLLVIVRGRRCVSVVAMYLSNSRLEQHLVLIMITVVVRLLIIVAFVLFLGLVIRTGIGVHLALLYPLFGLTALLSLPSLGSGRLSILFASPLKIELLEQYRSIDVRLCRLLILCGPNDFHAIVALL
uniref:Secreted protein n=1 Tax=Anopheles darlingi TaxID=43151 RepID=A0A2M4CZY7_ANODA